MPGIDEWMGANEGILHGAAPAGAMEQRQGRLGHALQFGWLHRGVQSRAALVERLVLDERQHIVGPAAGLPRAETAIWVPDPLPAPSSGGQMAMSGFMHAAAEGDLTEMVRALSPSRRLARRLHRGQAECQNHGHDVDDDQQFDDRHSASESKG
jgi:hypothetical protein